MGAFDDLLPKKQGQGGAFDDLIPAAKEGADKPKIDLNAPVGSEGFMGGVADLARQSAKGVISGIPEFLGKSIDFAADRPTEIGGAIQEFGKQMDEATPSLNTSIIGQRESADPWSVRGAAGKAGESMALSFGPMLAGAGGGAAIGAAGGPIGAAGGAAIGALAALPLFYGSQAYDTQKRVEEAQLKAGATPEDAHANAREAAHLSGGIEAGGELLADVIPLGKMFKPLAATAGKAAGTAVRSLFEGGLKKAAKTIAATEAGEISTEMAQQAGQAAVEGAYGSGEGATWKDTAQVILPTAIMSLFPGGLAAAHNFKTTQDIKKTLGDGAADPEARGAAASMVFSQLNGDSPQAAQAFSLYARDQILAGKPVEIHDDNWYGDYLVKKARDQAYPMPDAPAGLLEGPGGPRLGHAPTDEDRQAAIDAAQAHADAVYAARDDFETQRAEWEAQNAEAAAAAGQPDADRELFAKLINERIAEDERAAAVEAARQAALPSRQAGLDPAQGPITAMAAHAMDTGATQLAAENRAGPIAQAEAETHQTNIEAAAKEAAKGPGASGASGGAKPAPAPADAQIGAASAENLTAPAARAPAPGWSREPMPTSFFPFPNAEGAARRATALSQSLGEPYVAIPHPYQHDKFTVVPQAHEAAVMALQGGRTIPRAPATPPPATPPKAVAPATEAKTATPEVKTAAPEVKTEPATPPATTPEAVAPEAPLSEDDLGAMFDEAAAKAKAETAPKAPETAPKAEDALEDAPKTPTPETGKAPETLTPTSGNATPESPTSPTSPTEPEAETPEAADQRIKKRDLDAAVAKHGAKPLADEAAESFKLPPPPEGEVHLGPLVPTKGTSLNYGFYFAHTTNKGRHFKAQSFSSYDEAVAKLKTDIEQEDTRLAKKEAEAAKEKKRAEKEAAKAAKDGKTTPPNEGTPPTEGTPAIEVTQLGGLYRATVTAGPHQNTRAFAATEEAARREVAKRIQERNTKRPDMLARASAVYQKHLDTMGPKPEVEAPTDAQRREQLAEQVDNPERYHPVVEADNPKGLMIGDRVSVAPAARTAIPGRETPASGDPYTGTVVSVDTAPSAYPGGYMVGVQTDTGYSNWVGIDRVEKIDAPIAAKGTVHNPLKFVSGMSRPGDFTKALQAGANIGIEIGELSAVSIPKIAKELVAAQDSHLFVDTGAYTVFRHNQRLHEKGEFEGFKELDWKSIFEKFDALARAVSEADEANGGAATKRMHFVMPDVVGNQGESLYLLREHAEEIVSYIESGEAIIPLQAGKLSLVEAFDEAKSIFGGRIGWSVGIPTNMHAASDEQVAELIEKRGDEIGAIHILGGVADGKIAARIKALGDFDGDVSADANRFRALLWGDTDRATAMRRALSEAQEPPAVTVDGKRIPSVEELRDLLKPTNGTKEADYPNVSMLNERFMPNRVKLQSRQMGGGYFLQTDGFIGDVSKRDGPLTAEKARAWLVDAHKIASGLSPLRPEPKKLTADELKYQNQRDAEFAMNRALKKAVAQGGSNSLIASLEKAKASIGTRFGVTAGMAEEIESRIDKLVEASKKDPAKTWTWEKPQRESADAKKARLRAAEEARKAEEKARKEALRQAQVDAYNALKNTEALVDAAGKDVGEFDAIVRAELGKYLTKRAGEVETTAAKNALHDMQTADHTKMVKSLHEEAKRAAKIRAREAKKAAEKKRAEKVKLKNTGADLRRHWELIKAERRKAEDADGTTSMNQILAATTRADLFADLLGEGATPGAGRVADMLRDAVIPFKKWAMNHTALDRMGGSHMTDAERIKAWVTGSRGGYLSAKTYEAVTENAKNPGFTPSLDDRLALLRHYASLWMDDVKLLTDVVSGKTGVDQLHGAIVDLLWKKEGQNTEKYWRGYSILDDSVATSIGKRLKESNVVDRYKLVDLAPGSGWIANQVKNESVEDDNTRAKPLVPPRLEAIKRDLPPARDGSVKPKDLKFKFDFADIGFGTWVAAKEDQANLDLAWDSFSDMASLIGISPSAIGFKGKLHFTIGALGHGSKAAATFHPNHPGPNGTTVQVINLTKTKGDGTVAHEWGHALDHFLRYTREGKMVMSQIIDALKTKYDFQRVREGAIRGLKGGSWIRGQKNVTPEQNARNLVEYYARNKPATQYKVNADRLGEKYWGNDKELFARAWESWVSDALGGVNNYLVNPDWVGDGRVKPPVYKGIPYPGGEERVEFNRWMKALASSLIIKGNDVAVDLDTWEKNKPDTAKVFQAAVEELIQEIPMLQAQLEAEAAAKRQAARDAELAKQGEIQEARRKAAEEARKAAEEAQKREDAITNPPPPPAVDPNAPLNEEDLDALFDDAVNDLKAENNENPKAPEPGAPAFNNDPTPTPPKFEKERMSVEDRDFFTKLLDSGKKILLGGNDWGIPSIQSVKGADFKGYGLFEARGPGWVIQFDGGGEMSRSPGGVPYTVIVEKEGSYPYNTQGVRFDLIEAAGGTIGAPDPAAPKAPDPKATQLIAEAAKLGVKGIDEALSGLTKLFGGGKIQSFPGGFDEDSYKAAKPHFEAALKAFQAAGKTLKDLFKMLVQQFGEGVKPYAIRFAQDMKLTAGLGQNQPAIGPSSSMRVANWVSDELHAGRAIEWPALFAKANEAFGGTQGEGKYTPKDAYDAAEAGINKVILGKLHFAPNNDRILGRPGIAVISAKAQVGQLSTLTQLLPTQTKRTQEMDEFQQFSTVPALAYMANWVANITPGETYLEPSGGIGGLAVFGKLAGANLVVNELSSRRAAVLRDVLPDARVFTEDAEQIDNVLPDDVRPTTIVMNPPFSATGGRVEGQRDNRNGIRHLEQALERLAPGGRLVAILGRGMGLDHVGGRKFIESAKEKYTVRAVIPIDGAEYAKYGTTFDNVLIVIDKVGPHTGDIVSTPAKAYAELPALLEGVRNARREPTALDRIPEPGVAQPDGGGTTAPGGPGTTQRPGTSGVGPGSRSGGRTGNSGGGTTTTSGPGTGTTTGNLPRPQQGGDGPSGGLPGGAGAGGSGEGSGGEAGGAGKLELDHDGAAKRNAELTDNIYENYSPEKAKIKGSKPHPGKLVESAAMAAVEPLDAHYSPHLPSATITEGKISDAQIEPVIYAGQAHSELLPNGERRGFFIGDGTGVGKGREISAIILDNQQQGRKKHLWISASSGLFGDPNEPDKEGAIRDFKGVGGDWKRHLFKHHDLDYGEITRKEGILFSTYGMLRQSQQIEPSLIPFNSSHEVVTTRGARGKFVTMNKSKRTVKFREDGKKADKEVSWDSVESIGGDRAFSAKLLAVKGGDSRLQQIIDWLGPDFDGVIAFDEAHKMSNLGGEGKDPSAMALAAMELQTKLPQARVIYVSATGATEVSNLMYATRLGLWGANTPFPDSGSFHQRIKTAGLAAMELVARDLKAMGAYIARSLSYDGVEQERMNIQLTPLQSEIYDELAGAWSIVLQNFEAALAATSQDKNAQSRKNAASALWGTQQRFFNQIITAMQVPEIIERAKKELAAGNSVVFQLVNTNEAPQERMVAEAEAEGKPLEELDFTPRQALIAMVLKAFPVAQYNLVAGPNGTVISVPVRDANGNPVISKAAVKMRDALIAKLEEIRVPENPVDIIIEALGAKNVAEITGREQRFHKKFNRDGSFELVSEKRTDANVKQDASDFQDGKKTAIIISDAGGTGYSFHSDLSKKNQRRRIHFLVQAGWRADNVIQGFGRTHRTNEANQPLYILPSTNLKSQKRFISSIARRLDQLGALTKGQRDTASQGLFTNRDNLESKYAIAALRSLLMDWQPANAHTGAFNADATRIITAMGLQGIYNENGTLVESRMPKISRFLNRMLSLKIADQDSVFADFETRMDAAIDHAIEQGTFDDGMQTIKALKVTKTRDETVYTDPRSGARTRYLELELTRATTLNSWDKSQEILGAYPGKGWAFYQDQTTGQVYAIVDLGTRIGSDGKIQGRGYRVAPLAPSQASRGSYITNLNHIKEGGDWRYVTRDDQGNIVKAPESSRWSEDTKKIRRYRTLSADEARYLWDEQYASAPQTQTSSMNMLAGILLPVWDRIDTGDGRATAVVRTQTDDGERFIGRLITEDQKRDVLTNFGLGALSSDIPAAELMRRIIAGAVARLSNGWFLRKSKVSNDKRIEITSSYFGTSDLKGLRDQGAIIERIGYQERAFIPTNADTFEALTRGANRPVVDLTDESEDAKFSVGTKGPGMQRGAVAHAISKIARNWKAGPRIEVVQSVSQLPFKAPATARGAFWGERLFLVADNIRSPEAAQFVLLHEAAGHYGLKAVLGGQLPWVMQSIYKSNANVREMADKRIAHAAQAGLAYDITRATEEALADLAGAGKIAEVRGWRLLVAKVRAALREIGFTIAVTDEDVAILLKKASDSLGGPPAGAEGPKLSLKTHPFYSAFQAGIGSAPWPKSGTMKGPQLKSWIESRVKDGLFKQEEVNWLGIKEYLDLHPTVTKTEIANFVSGRTFRVKDIILGARNTAWAGVSRDVIEADLTALGYRLEEDLGMMPGEAPSIVEIASDDWVAFDDVPAAVQELLQQWMAAGVELHDTPTMFSKYQLPGGANYTELVLQLEDSTRERALADLARGLTPKIVTDPREFEQLTNSEYEMLEPGDTAYIYDFPVEGNGLADGYYIKRANGTFWIPDIDTDHYPTTAEDAAFQTAQMMDRIVGLDLPKFNGFYGGHFHEPNVIAHVRMNERVDDGGKRVLFIEEIQSDWAQAGRESGFQGENRKSVHAYREFVQKMRSEARQRLTEAATNDAERATADRLAERALMADPMSLARMLGLENELYEHEEAMRQPNAVAPGPFVQKTESWTTLALKRIVRYAAENGFERVAWTTGDEQIDRYQTALRQRVSRIDWELDEQAGYTLVSAYDNDDQNVFSGKARAGRFTQGVASGKTIDEVLGKEMADKLAASPSGSMTGDDLAIGGKGMRKSYDEIIPQLANKLLRQLGGGEVVEVRIPFNRKTMEGVARKIVAPVANMIVGGTPHMGFDVTPEMVEKAMAGQPMFSLDGIMGAGIEAVKATFDNPRKFNWWHRTVGTQFHKAQVVPAFRPVFEASQRYLQDVSQLAIDASDKAPTWLPRLGTFSDVLNIVSGPKKADMAAASKIMFEGTLNKKRPDAIALRNLTGPQRQLYTQARAAIDLSLGQVAKSELHKLTVDEGIDGARRRAKDMPVHAALTHLTNALADQLDVLQSTGGKQSEINRKARLLDQMQEVVDKSDKLKAEGYVPLMRFGKYAVDVTHVEKNAKGEDVIVRDYFGMFESNREAAAAARQAGADFPQSEVKRSTMDDESWKLFQGLSLDSLHTFADASGMREHHLFQEYYKLAVSARSALTRLIHRKGIAGYNEDMQRILASFITSNARLASRNYHFGEMQRAATRIPNELGDVKEEAAKLVSYVQNPVEEAHRVRGLLFVNFLGGSIASALTNATQPVMMTLPYLSKFGGTAQAARELAAAAGIAAGNVPADANLRAALDRAGKEGITEPQELHQLYAESIRGLGSSMPVRRALKAWGAAFSLAETFNRRITFAAAFTIAQKQGMKDPFAFAEKAVEDTQGIYNRGNRPNWARGTIGATVFTFKQYSIAYLEFIKRLPPKEKAIAGALLILAAGVQGLPGADDIEDLIDTIGQMLGYNTNSQQSIREFAIDVLGDQLGAFVMHGVSGISGSPVDVQQRMGLANIVPGTGVFMRSNPDKTREIAEFVGPIGGVYTQAARAVEALQAGAPGRALQQGTPIAVQNLMRGIEMAETGEYRDAAGRKVVNVTGVDAAFKAIGLQPKSVGERQRVAGEVQQSVRMVRVVEQSIADRWTRGIIDQKPEEVQRAVAELHAWNLANPDWKILISPAQIKARVEATKISRDARLMKSAPPEVRANVLRILNGT